MHHTRDPRQPNRGQGHEPATAEKQGALLSLSWYSSVPKAAAHLTLSRVSAPRAEGGPSFLARAWVASRSSTAGPRSAWRKAAGNDSVVQVTDVELSPRRNWGECHLQSGTSFPDQGGRALVAQGGPQDAQRTPGGCHTGDTAGFRLFELGV